MTYLLYGVLGFILISGSVKAKNKIEDIVVTKQDSFIKYDYLFKLYGGDNWKILKAIAMNESSLGDHPSVKRGILNPSDVEGSKSEDGKSWGLMQMTVTTARDYDSHADPVLLNNPEYSIKLASLFLRSLQRQFTQLEHVVKAYNQGAGNTRKEIRGEINGYAQSYWERFQRNFRVINDKQGGLI